MNRVAISGGAGFIGSAVARELERRNIEPIILDHKYDIDIVKANLWEYLHNCDAVIHLAGVLGTSELFDKPQSAVEINVIGTLNVLQACRDLEMSYVGITMPQVWKNVYQATKKCAQDLATAWHKNFDVPVSHVRAFNVYGPGQKVHGVQKIFPTFASKAWRNEDLPVWGSGKQKVDLIDVDQTARVLCDALGFGNDELIDAGIGEGFTVNEIADRIIADTNSSSQIIHLPMRKGEQEMDIVAEGVGWENLDWRPEWNEKMWEFSLDWYKQDRD